MSSALRTKYRTKDGMADYQFLFVNMDDGSGWRAYIESQPSYRGRDAGGHQTHRLTDSGGRRYVCWKGVVQTLDGMKQIAALWADCTQEYIRTGKRFG